MIRILFLFLATATILIGVDARGCDASTPNIETPVGAPKPPGGFGWYGSDDLAAAIPSDGNWMGMGPERDFGDKFWWWRAGYDVQTNSDPGLTISATLLNSQESSVVRPFVTNAFHKDSWDAILVGMEFPSPGCWRVIGTTEQGQLSVILKVGA